MERQGRLERPKSAFVFDFLRRVVDIKGQEISGALGSFITFALVLGGYYLVRPVRENIGAEASADQRQLWFLLVFAVMLAAVPLFGWVVARKPIVRAAPQKRTGHNTPGTVPSAATSLAHRSCVTISS